MKIFTITALLLIFSLNVAHAEDIMPCNLGSQGVVQCMSDRMCECKFIEPGTMSSGLPGFQWDCGITRPACIDFNQVDATKPYDGPDSVDLGTQIDIQR